MTSIYRTMGPSAFSSYILANTTLSATDFILGTSEVSFRDQQQASGVLHAFADNPKLNRQFNRFYQEAKNQSSARFDGDAHLLLQSAAMYSTIMANRKLFPPDEMTFSIALTPDDIRTITIPSVLAMAGALFKQEHEQYLARFEQMLAQSKARKDAETAAPADSAKKASDTLMSIIIEQQKHEDQSAGDPLKVLLKDALDDRTGKPDPAGAQSADVTMADKASVAAVAKVLAKGGSVNTDTVNEAYAEH